MNKLIIALIVTISITQVWATQAQCKQSYGLFQNDIQEHQYNVEQKLNSRITLSARNVVSSYEMARSYCRDDSYYTQELLLYSDLIQRFKSALNIR
jgi:hypothetical protein